MTTAAHPAADDLADFALGRLEGDAERAVEAHLETCDTCRAHAAAAPADGFVALLRDATQIGDTSIEAHLDRPTLSDTVALPLTETPPELAGSRYRPIRLLGRGGMGAVWLAEHRLMGREVAVKVIHAELLRKEGAAARFRQEVHAAARLAHPNIVTAFDADESGEAHLLAMEYVEGATLADEVRARGALPMTEACDAISQAALGLQHAHERGLVHRDLKPHNLMRTRDGVVKILDFGLAVLSGDADASLTGTNVVLGTPDYIAPEQAEGSRNADARSDIYSLGCTLYHLLAGAVPFPADSVLRKLDAQRREEPKALAGVPRELAGVVAKMMAKDPARRYQSAAEVAAALTPFTRAIPPKRERRTRLLVAAAFFAVALAAGVVIRLQTAEGEVVITPHSPDVEIVLLQGGKQVRILDTKTNKKVTLPVGEYDVKLKDNPDGVELKTDRVTVRRGAEVLVTIERVAKREPAKEARPPLQPPQPAKGGEHGEVWRAALHERGAYNVAFLPGGQFSSTGADGALVIGDVATGKVVARTQAHADAAFGLAVSPDGKRIVTGGSDRRIQIWGWNGTTMTIFPRVEKVTLPVFGVAISPDGKLFAGTREEKGWGLWDMETGDLVHSVTGYHTNSVAFSPDGKHLWFGGEDGVPRLWDIAGRKEIEPARPPRLDLAWIRRLVVHPDGKAIYTATGNAIKDAEKLPGDDCAVSQWRTDATRRRTRVSGKGFDLAVQGLAIDAAGTRLIAGSADGTVEALDLSRLTVLRRFQLPSAVECAALSPDGTQALIGDEDGNVRLFLMPAARETPTRPAKVDGELWRLPAHRGKKVHGVALLPGDLFASCGADGAIISGDARPVSVNREGGRYSFHGMSAQGNLCLAASPDGRRLAVGHDNGVAVYATGGGKLEQVRELAGATGPVEGVAISPDGKLVAGSQGDKGWKLWDAVTGKLLHSFEGPNASVLAFSPDGTLVLAGGKDGSPRLWDIARKTRTGDGADDKKPAVRRVAFAPDGKSCFTGHADGRVVEWAVRGEPSVRVLATDSRHPVTALAVSPDGSLVAAGSADGMLKVCRLSDGLALKTITLPRGVECLAFSPDGRSLLVGDDGGDLRLFRMPQRKTEP